MLLALGWVLIGLALVAAYFAAMFRFDSWDEYQGALRGDVEIGFVFAMGVALLAVPPAGMNTLRWRVLWVTASLLAWLTVSGGLAGCHHQQYVVRSSPPIG